MLSMREILSSRVNDTRLYNEVSIYKYRFSFHNVPPYGGHSYVNNTAFLCEYDDNLQMLPGIF